MYDGLQLGVSITSTLSEAGAFLHTTAELVRTEGVGREFMTAAAEVIPPECGSEVIHPLPAAGRRVVTQVPHTVIYLMKLCEDEKFFNVTFQSDDVAKSDQLETEPYRAL